MPSMYWNNSITSTTPSKTLVSILLKFETIEALEGIIKMGFKEGFTMGLGNLDELITTLKK